MLLAVLLQRLDLMLCIPANTGDLGSSRIMGKIRNERLDVIFTPDFSELGRIWSCFNSLFLHPKAVIPAIHAANLPRPCAISKQP